MIMTMTAPHIVELKEQMFLCGEHTSIQDFLDKLSL